MTLAAALLPVAAAAAAVVVLVVQHALGFEPALWHVPFFRVTSAAAVIAAAAAGVLLRRRAAGRAIESPALSAAASWLLAIEIGVFLLLAGEIAAVRPVPEDRVTGWLFGYVNKRWLVTSYNIALLTMLVLPVAVHRARGRVPAPVECQPRRSTLAGRWRSWARRAAGVLIVAALALYFAGPPWHLERHHRTLDWHEQAHLGSLQAISKGYVPYIGPASTQWGPGSQLLIYATMRATGQFDIVSFRTAWAIFNLIGWLIVLGVAYYWIGVAGLVAIVPLTLACSPLAFYGTQPDGTFGGYYGWANSLRYALALIVVPALASLAADDSGATRWPLALRAILIGAVVGVSAWLAQESLSAILAASGLMLAVLWLTRSATGAQIVRVLAGVAAGFSCVAAPIAVFYAWHGALREFLFNYMLVPRAIFDGYTNSWWNASADRTTYYGTFPFLLAAAVCTIWRMPALRVEPLDFRRRRLLSFLCVQFACFQTVLLRSDPDHLMGTFIALPFVLFLGLVDLPRFVASGWPGRFAAAAVFLAAVLTIFPVLRTTDWTGRVVAPIAKLRSQDAAAPVPIKYGNRVGFKRATRWLTDEPSLAVGSGLSMRTFLEFASDLHDLVGTRKTYVAGVSSGCAMTVRADCVWVGAVYFMADLVPAPYPLDRDTVMMNDPLRDIVSEHIRTHPRDYECLITRSLTAPETREFLSAHPDAEIVQRQLGPHEVHVLLARAGGSPAHSS